MQRNQRSHWQHLLEKAREFQKKMSTASLTMLKPLTVWSLKLWKMFKEMRIPDHLTCLLRNLYVGQETAARKGHGTTDWFKIGKGAWQGYILSPDYNSYSECYVVLCFVAQSCLKRTSWEMLSWMNHNLKSKLPGEISTISHMLAHMAKNPWAMWETWVWFLGWEDALEKGIATHSSILAWRIPMDRGAWRAWFHGVARSWTQLSV